jgi:hypothetical protein
MKHAPKTAIGVDISAERINLALLRQGADGLELIKTAACPVPEGAIEDGNVEDPSKLSQAIKSLRTRSRIPRVNHTAVSLLTKPTVMQILDMPKGIPTNIGRLVQNEISTCVALSGKEIAMDFCRITWGHGQGSRLLAVAADAQKITKLAEACARGGLNAEVIEPPLLAYARALHDKNIQDKFDSDVLIAVLRDGALNICVFKKQILDFVTTRIIDRELDEPGRLGQWLAKEINEIIRFYEMEVIDSSGKWQITVVADSVALPQEAARSLTGKIENADLRIRTAQTVSQDTPVTPKDARRQPSAVAIGLAMRLLKENDSSLRVNLLPPESTEVKAAKKHLLITTNIVAAVILLTILTAGALAMMANKVNQRVTQKKKNELSQDTYILLQEQEKLEEQIRHLSDRPERLQSILDSRHSVNWARILEDIGKMTPKMVRITNLYSNDNTTMYLDGLALSYEMVHLFVKMLDQSEYINSASLNETVREDKTGGLVKYVIVCSLTQDKEE